VPDGILKHKTRTYKLYLLVDLLGELGCFFRTQVSSHTPVNELIRILFNGCEVDAQG